MKMFSTTKNIVLVVFFISSIALNVATVALEAVATAMSGMFEAVTGLQSGQTKMVRNKQMKSQKIVRDISGKISGRTVKAAARNAGAVVAEAVPYAGIAVIVAVTTADLYDACETMKDMRALGEAVELGVPNDQNTSHVCGMTVPDAKTIWSKVSGSW